MKSLIARFFICLFLAFSALPAAVSYPPPTDWKAITYFPRYHSFWRMLYEWDDYDSRLGKTVSAAVDDDMNILAASGVNVLHTYIWDQALLTSAVKGRWCTDRNNADPKLRGRYFANCTLPYNEPGGFASAPFNPSFSLQRNSGRTQLVALDEFITKAEQHGLFVLIHFASGRLIAGTSGMCIDMVGGGAQCDPDYPFLPNLSPNPAYNGKTSQTVAQEHNAWINAFVSYLGRSPNGGVPVHKNILAWGLGFAVGASPGIALTERPNIVLGLTYKYLFDLSKNLYFFYPQLGDVALNLGWRMDRPSDPPAMFHRPASGYLWHYEESQAVVKTTSDILCQPTLFNCQVGTIMNPGLWMIQAYSPNAQDQVPYLTKLVSPPNPPDASRYKVPIDRLLVVEFATGSSVSSMGVESYGDNNTATTDFAGQQTWLKNNLCAFTTVQDTSGGGSQIRKYAYWSMYDATSLWSNSPWYNYGSELGWSGFWGLYRESDGTAKNAWSTYAAFNNAPGSIGCPTGNTPYAPSLTVRAISDYVTVGVAAKLAWTLNDYTTLLVDGTESTWPGSMDCDSPAAGITAAMVQNMPPATSLQYDERFGGGCAFGFANPTYSTGYRSIPVRADQTRGGVTTSAYATVGVTAGTAPIVYYVSGQYYQGQTVSISAYSILSVQGKGFSFYPFNYFQFTRPGYTNVWAYQGDGYPFYSDAFFVFTGLGGRLAPGLWTVILYNGHGAQISIPINVY